MAAHVIGYLFIAISYAFHLNPHRRKIDWGASKWLFPYYLGMGVIFFFGSSGMLVASQVVHCVGGQRWSLTAPVAPPPRRGL